MQNIKGGDAVKSKNIFMVIIMVALVFSGCGKISDDLKTVSSKQAGHQNTGAEAVTSMLPSSEPSSELSEPDIFLDNQSSQASLSSAVSSAVTSKTQSSSKPPAAQSKTEPIQSSAAPASSAPAVSPYRKNCWGTPEIMENDLAVYTAGIEMQYDKTMTLDDGHWITPLSSWGATSASNYKKLIEDDISFNFSRGYTRCRVIFEGHETLNAYLAYIVVD